MELSWHGSIHDNHSGVDSLVYGPPVLSLRPMFWTLLNEIEAAYCGPWLIVGDFNVVLNQSDKNRGNQVASSSNGGFQNMIDFNGLLDLEFIGSPFTWNNRRVGNANIREKLDKAFANGEWKLRYPSTPISHLPTINSDRKPIFIQPAKSNTACPRPFQFDSMWLRDSSISAVVEEAWKKGHPFPTLSHFMTKLKYTKVAIKD